MIAIHQSQFLPWLPYFHKMLKSDIFVVLDDVQFQKNGVQNRNMIKTINGSMWLTIPVKFSFGDPIYKVEIAERKSYKKVLKTLNTNYAKSDCFNKIYTDIKDIFDRAPSNLNDLNMQLLDRVLNILGTRPNIYNSRHIKTTAKKEDLIIEIIKHFGGKKYISGPGGLRYMNLKKFKNAGIDVYLSNFSYREYKQNWNKQISFVSNLSIVDLLFNDCENAKQYIIDNGTLEKII